MFALSKDSVLGTVRPIAMGECIRKLAAAMCIKCLQPKIQSYFSELQYGQSPAGTEKIIHAINYIRSIHPDWDLVTLDCKNAFNLVSRLAIARELCSHFPHLLGYFKNFYFDQTSLLLRDRLVH